MVKNTLKNILPSYSQFDQMTRTVGLGEIFVYEIEINDIKQKWYGRQVRRILRQLHSLKCPYCKGTLSALPSCAEFEPYPKNFAVYECRECGFWKTGNWREIVDVPGISASSYHTAVSKLQEYPLTSNSIPFADLQSYVRRNPEALRSIHWRALEKLVADVFRASRSFHDVIHVGKTNDGGVDVILVVTNSERILVQVKRRTRPSIEPVSTVRNLLGAMIAHGTLDGIVVSTADHFSSYAQSFVEKLTKSRIAYKIELKDFGKLKEMISSYRSEDPWKQYLRRLPPTEHN